MTEVAFMGYSKTGVFTVGGSYARIQETHDVLSLQLWFCLLPNFSYFCLFWDSLSNLPSDFGSFSIFCQHFFSILNTARLDFYYLQLRTLIYIPLFKNLFKHFNYVLCLCYEAFEYSISAKQNVRLWFYTQNLFLHLHMEINYILYNGYNSKS